MWLKVQGDVEAVMKQARKILEALTQEGWQAYMVGGAVRDLFLGVNHIDVDICTNAKPDDIRAMAIRRGWKTSDVGARFGSVLVVIAGIPYDVTTFRREEYGEDSHRPKKVEWGDSLLEDLSRRDFTINTLCLDVNGDLYDPFGGLSDLRLGRIRAVGEATVRFAEDGLRMFRAARFMAQLGFSFDTDIFPAIVANRERVRGLSVERVRNELEKTLLARHAAKGIHVLRMTGLLAETCRAKDEGVAQNVPILPELMHLYQLPQNPKHHRLNAWRHVLDTVERIEPQLALRWAALLHDVAKGLPGVRGVNAQGEWTDHRHDVVGTELAENILSRLRVDPQVAKRAVWLVRNHMHAPDLSRKSVVRWLRKRAVAFRDVEELRQAVMQLFALYWADATATRTKPNDSLEQLLQKVEPILQQTPFFVSQLASSGGDIAAELGRGPQVGAFQKNLLQRIQSGMLKNEADVLRQALLLRKERQKQLQ